MLVSCLKFLVIFFLLGLVFFPSDSIVSAQEIAPISPDTILIKFKPQASLVQKENIKNTLHLKLAKKISQIEVEVTKTPPYASSAIISQLKTNPLVEFAEPDFIAQAVDIPNDPLYSQQWGLTKIQAPNAWNIILGKSPTTLAIVDTGINGAHPDLAGKVVARANFSNDSDADGNGHGTHVAGIAAALTNNNLGVAGVSNSNLLSVKVLDNSGSGSYSSVASGVSWAADNGARVINLSLGGSASSQTLKTAIDYAWGKGVVVVAAAGNSNTTIPFYPSSYTNAIAVAATDQNDQRASFSNYGSSWVDLAAPGVSILSTYGSDYQSLSGTSMATPFVTGVAGLVFSNHPDWTNQQVRQKIEGSADKIAGTGSSWSSGRVNACSAVDCANTVIAPSPTPSPSPSPSGPSLVIQGFNGEYFNNQNLLGTPTLTKTDPTINFNWGYAAPAAGIPVDRFSIRWAATITPQITQSYTFTTITDDGVRFWINDQLLINDWHNHAATTRNTPAIVLNANQSYTLKMEYYDYTGKASAKLSWQPL